MRVSKYFQQSRTNNRGFTLIEILIAIFISALILTVLYTSFFQIINARDKVQYEMEMLQESRVIFSRLRNDLSNAYPRGSVSAVSQNNKNVYFKGTVVKDNSQLYFTSLAKDPAPDTNESDQVEIVYYLVPIRDSDLYALVRSENPWFGNQDGGVAYPISERVVSFKVNFITDEYLNAQNPEPIREWDSSLLGRYPRAAEVVVTLRGENGEDTTFTSMIYIPVSN